MKKIFYFVLLVCSCSLFAQTGVGWQQIRYKPNFLDSANFAKQFKVGGITVRSNAQELNILDSALVAAYELNRIVGILSPVQTQLNGKVSVIDSALMLSKYLRKADTTLASLGYFSKFKGNAVELDLATYSTFPAPTTAGNIPVADGSQWVSSPPTNGGGSVPNKLQFVVGITSGAPSAGDSIITHTSFVEKHVEVYRGVNGTQGGGTLQHRNPTGALQTTTRGYRFDKQTGIIITKPVLATNDEVIVQVTDSTTQTDLTFPAVSSLLTGIKTYYKLDETVGTALTDAVGNKNITTDATINQTGIIGKAVKMGWKKELNGSAYNATTTLNHATWTVKTWIKLDSFPAATGRAYTLFVSYHSPAPWWNVKISVATNNHLRVRVTNNAQAVMESYGDTISVVGRWYHVAVTFKGNGYATQIYKDGYESTEAGAQIFSGTLWQANLGEYWGASDNVDNAEYVSGYLDECGTWARAWSAGEVLQNYNDEKILHKTYPWAP